MIIQNSMCMCATAVTTPEVSTWLNTNKAFHGLPPGSNFIAANLHLITKHFLSHAYNVHVIS